MRLLVSVVNRLEAQEAVRGGADIVDVKNPLEGALGAQRPSIIREVSEALPPGCELSATIGDLPNLPGTASLAALGAVVAGADYVKAGLFGVSTVRDAAALLASIVEAVESYDAAKRVVAAGYADYQAFGSIAPALLPSAAAKAGCYGILVDLKAKGSSSLFDHYGEDELKSLITAAHSLGLKVALAGGLGERDIARILALEADIIGVRRAVCSSKDWVAAQLDGRLVASFKDALQRAAYRSRNYYSS
ncbi:MAG: (5-formylfuran-3-yl)methyl phosphate synthase [Candidatus Bathyarchaeia archaeon]